MSDDGWIGILQLILAGLFVMALAGLLLYALGTLTAMPTAPVP